METCKDCEYYEGIEGVETGICKRFPPTTPHTQPKVKAALTACGEGVSKIPETVTIADTPATKKAPARKRK